MEKLTNHLNSIDDNGNIMFMRKENTNKFTAFTGHRNSAKDRMENVMSRTNIKHQSPAGPTAHRAADHLAHGEEHERECDKGKCEMWRRKTSNLSAKEKSSSKNYEGSHTL